MRLEAFNPSCARGPGVIGYLGAHGAYAPAMGHGIVNIKLQRREERMTQLNGRGYLIAHGSSYLRDNVSKEDWKRIQSEFSPELQRLLGGQVKHAEWYSIALWNEVTSAIVTSVAKGDNDRAQEALHQCGRFIAREATNTFLKIFLKMLTPGLFVKKLPDVFGRDFSSGRMVTELSGRTLTARIYDAPGFNHAIVTSTGFVATALETMGKKIEKISVLDWSLEKPNVDGTRFDLTWKD